MLVHHFNKNDGRLFILQCACCTYTFCQAVRDHVDEFHFKIHTKRFFKHCWYARETEEKKKHSHICNLLSLKWIPIRCRASRVSLHVCMCKCVGEYRPWIIDEAQFLIWILWMQFICLIYSVITFIRHKYQCFHLNF